MKKKNKIQPLMMIRRIGGTKKKIDNGPATKKPIPSQITNSSAESSSSQLDVPGGERSQLLDLASRGNEHFAAGEYDIAIKMYTEVLRKSSETRDRHVTSRILINIGNVHLQRDELDKAMKAFTMALRLAQELCETSSGGSNDEGGATTVSKNQKFALVADALQNVGIVHLERGQFRLALNKNSEALKLRRKCLETLLADDAGAGLYTENRNEAVDQVLLEIAEVLNSIGMCSEREGKYVASIAAYEEALQIRRSILGQGHPDVATSLFNLGGCHTEVADFDSAMSCFKQALEVRRSLLGDRHVDVADALNSIAGIHLRRGDYENAMRCCSEAVTIASSEAEGSSDFIKVATALNTMGMINERLGNMEGALQSYTEALNVKTKFLGANHPSVASTLHNIGNIYYENKDYDEAMMAYLESLKVKEMTLGPDHPSAAVTLNNIGTVYCFKEQYDEALSYHNRALELWSNALGEEQNHHPSIADTLNSIGVALKGKGQREDALDHFRRALEIYKRANLPTQHPGVSSAIRNIADISERQACTYNCS